MLLWKDPLETNLPKLITQVTVYVTIPHLWFNLLPRRAKTEATGKTLCSISSLWACLKPATKIQEWERKPSKPLSQNMENMAAGALRLEVWNFFHYPFWVHFYPCLVPLSVCTNIFHWQLPFVWSRFDISEYSTLPTGLRGSSTYPAKKMFHVSRSSPITAKQHISKPQYKGELEMATSEFQGIPVHL